MAAAVSRVNPTLETGGLCVRRSIALDHETWEKLARLAETTAQTTSKHITASQVAAAIIEQFVAALSQQDETQD